MGDKIRNLVGLILLIGICYMRYSLSRDFTLNCFDLHIQLVMVIAVLQFSLIQPVSTNFVSKKD